jgi:hypothetical protein
LSRCSVIDDILYINFKELPDETFDDNDFDLKHELHKMLMADGKTNYKTHITSYSWENEINYKVLGECNFYLKNASDTDSECNVPKVGVVRKFMAASSRFIIKYIKTLRRFNYLELLACPKCKGDLQFNEDNCECLHCKVTYKKHKGSYDMRI